MGGEQGNSFADSVNFCIIGISISLITYGFSPHLAVPRSTDPNQFGD
jgi:hypothetical protein